MVFFFLPLCIVPRRNQQFLSQIQACNCVVSLCSGAVWENRFISPRVQQRSSVRIAPDLEGSGSRAEAQEWKACLALQEEAEKSLNSLSSQTSLPLSFVVSVHDEQGQLSMSGCLLGSGDPVHAETKGSESQDEP